MIKCEGHLVIIQSQSFDMIMPVKREPRSLHSDLILFQLVCTVHLCMIVHIPGTIQVLIEAHNSRWIQFQVVTFGNNFLGGAYHASSQLDCQMRQPPQEET